MALTQEEIRVLDLLYQDARITPERAAVMLGMTEQAVTEAIRHLEEERVIVGYPALINWDKTPIEKVKAVIIGQDPYHGPHQAHGLCFSVLKGIAPPPSLKNIFRELSDDVGFIPPHHGELTEWAKQGVLMLNSVLTVREHQPNSHKGMGWEIFTDRVISELNKKTEPVVFLLWGANARQKAKVITNPIHVKLETVHPSPLSAYNGFFGCKHFSKCNQILADSGQRTIEWQLSD